MGPDPESPAWAHRLGATEGTGLGFLAAGAILGMVWLGEIFGSELPVDEGGYAAAFLAVGTGILIVALGRARDG